MPSLPGIIYHRNYRINELKGEWHWVALFLILFFLMLDVRFVNPTISYAEKFMDHGFLASVMRNPVVPPLDPWFSGGTLDVYYYLGYWMFGCLAIVSGVPSNIAFNLALPTVFALAGVVAYAIGTLMLERFRWVTLLIFFLPNPSFFYNLALGKAPDFRSMGQYADNCKYHQRIPAVLIHMGGCPCPCNIHLQPGLPDLPAPLRIQTMGISRFTGKMAHLHPVRIESRIHAADQYMGRVDLCPDNTALRPADSLEEQDLPPHDHILDLPVRGPTPCHPVLSSVLY